MSAQLKRALTLEYFTIAWNVIEAGVAAVLGYRYASAALVAFGFDSLIETTAACIMVWRLRSELHGGADEARIEAAERRAAYWVGVTFYMLAAYVLFECAETVISGEKAHPGPWGVALAALSVVVMPWLYRAKMKAAVAINSEALKHEAAETIICAYLSGILLAGLLVNELFGLWWADTVAAVAMVYFIVKEGKEAIDASKGVKCSCGCH